MTNTNTITSLSHGQMIRVPSFRWQKAITVGTHRGSAARYGDDLTGVELQDPWALQECACLTADYPGKDEELDRKAAEQAAATPVEEGQIVEIEGELYRVHITGERYSDPVKFIPAE